MVVSSREGCKKGGKVWSFTKPPGMVLFLENIARGTTDPEIDSVTWIKFGNNMALIANLATR